MPEKYMAYTLDYLLRRLRGFLLLLKESLRYSATASRDVTQFRPIFARAQVALSRQQTEMLDRESTKSRRLG